jgi:hypothetical protein
MIDVTVASHVHVPRADTSTAVGHNSYRACRLQLLAYRYPRQRFGSKISTVGDYGTLNLLDTRAH